MTIKISKLFVHNCRLYASVRDYVVRNCIKKREPLTIIFRGEKMKLKPNQMRYFEQFTPDTFKSKTGGKNYKLWDYFWSPAKREDELENYARMGIFG